MSGSVPRYQDYFEPDGTPKGPAPVPKKTLAQRARGLARDVPVALDALNAFPAVAGVTGLARGLVKAPTAMRAVGDVASEMVTNPGLRRATRQHMGGYITGQRRLAEETQAAIATRNTARLEQLDGFKQAFRPRGAMSNAVARQYKPGMSLARPLTNTDRVLEVGVLAAQHAPTLGRLTTNLAYYRDQHRKNRK